MQQSKTQFLKPDFLLTQFDVQPGMHVGDLGCGTGYMSFGAARAVGPKGLVYAVDVQKAVLEQVKREAQAEYLSNITTIWSDLELVGATKIPQASLDVVLLVNMLFQVNNKTAVFKEANRLLKPSGRLLVVDWKPGNATIGPPPEARLDPQDVQSIAASAGFVQSSVINAGQYHFGTIFSKK